ncbi:hypothetical protein ACIBQ0_35865 [Nocardia nova]|uniref:hypothetical protein n=1 Tax=Nocardia nova TaxID=37330 RepID=UPI0037B3D686
MLTELINRTHSHAERIVVVIEDWHRVVDTDTVEAFRFLLDHACHHLQLLVTSRESVRLPLSALRVRGELIEIDSTALRFDRSEASEFLASAGCPSLGEGDIERLYSGTDGWVAGLQLACLSLRGREDPASAIDDMSGRHHAISEYLTDNVLDRLSPALLDNVLKTAVVEHICGDLASALIGTARGQAVLEDIERHDLFLHRVDDEGRWFRYHHLFAEFLRERLARDRPEAAPVLHRRAAAWFTEHEMLSEAIDHALAAGEPKQAVRLLADRALVLVQHSQLTTLTALAAKLPEAQATADPQLQIALAWAFALLRRADDMHAAMRSASAADSRTESGARPNPALPVHTSILRSVEQAHADRLAEVDAAVERCVSHAEAVPPFVLCAAANLGAFAALHRFEFDRAREWHRWGEKYFPDITGALSVVYSHCFAGMAAREQLAMATAEAHFRAALHIARTTYGESSLTVAVAAAMLGDFCYELGAAIEATKLLDATAGLRFNGGPVDFLQVVYGTGARIEISRGDDAAAERRLTDGSAFATAHGLSRLAARMAVERARLGLTEDSMRSEYSEPDSDGIAIVTAELRAESHIRRLLREAPHRAVLRAEALHQSIDRVARPRAHLYATILYAACTTAAGRSATAEPLLIDVISRCAAVGIVQPLLDEGPEFAVRIRALARERVRDTHRSLPPSFVDRLFTCDREADPSTGSARPG